MPDPQQRLSVDDFAAKIKAKYPDYADVDNATLVQKVVAKYPEYGDQVELKTQAEQPMQQPQKTTLGQDLAAEFPGGVPKDIFSGVRGIGILAKHLGQAGQEQAAQFEDWGRKGIISPTATGLMTFPGNAVGTIGRIGEGMASPQGAILTAASVHPVTRIPAAIYGGVSSGKSIFESLHGPMTPDKLEQFLLGSSGVVGSASLAGTGKLPTMPAAVKPTIGKVAGVLSDVVDPSITGIVSPRLAHIQGVLGRLSKAMEDASGKASEIIKDPLLMEDPFKMPQTRQVILKHLEGQDLPPAIKKAIFGEDTPPQAPRTPQMLALPPGQYEMPAGSPANQTHAAPASSNPLFTADPIFLQRQAAKTAGRPKLEMPVINPDRQPQPSSLTGGANAFETANPELLKSANARLKSWRDWHFIQNLKNEMNKQEGQGIQQADAFIQDHNQQAAGGKSTAYKAAARNSLGDSATDSQVTAMAQKLQQQDQDMAGLLQKSLEQAQAKKQSGASAQAQAMFDKAKAAQGGHAGGGVSSIEELNRPGVNYVVNKGGQITYHGKSFAPESTPAGAAHVTVLPGGKIRVNAGSLSDIQSAAIKRAVNEK